LRSTQDLLHNHVHASDPASRPIFATSSYFFTTLETEALRWSQPHGWTLAHEKTHRTLRQLAPLGDIFKLLALFVPIHINNNHWTSAVINFKTHNMSYLDSLGGSGTNQLGLLLRFLQAEHIALHNSPLPIWGHTPVHTPR
jgi:Ulp1 family protease